MQYTQTDNRYIIKIEKGEQVVSSLTQFAKEHAIQNAVFNGIGAVKGLTCGYYALDEKKYYFTEYDALIEVASLTGNIMLKEGEPFIHVHGVFTDDTNNAFGGHIQEMTVGVTLEVMMTVFATDLDRQLDEDIGLFLINCKDV